MDSVKSIQDLGLEWVRLKAEFWETFVDFEICSLETSEACIML